MDRMATHTRQPEVLQEFFEALGNDPFVIAECLARPVLAEGLGTSFAGPNEEQSKRWRTRAGNHLVNVDAAVNTNYMLPTISGNGCAEDVWTATDTTDAPSGRFYHTAIWTGSEMIVWGGDDFSNLFDSGGRYDPGTNTWTATNITNAPSARSSHTAVWTDSEMIVWGGIDDNVVLLDTGGKYSPSTNSWTATSTANAPIGRNLHTAVWTGNEMIVWGGALLGGNPLNTGGRYNPDIDSWASTSTTNVPSARYRHAAVWSGSEMLIWAGAIDPFFAVTNTGGRYCAQSGPPPTPTPTPRVTPRPRPTPHQRPSPPG
jgi:hypothetical protein